MRILVISDVTGYMRGGVPAVTRRLLAGLRARGHSIAFCGDIPLSPAEEVAHFPMAVQMSGDRAGQVRAAMAAFKPDFVHVMAMSSRGVLALFPVLSSHAWLLTCHSIPPYELKLAALHGSDTLHYAARNVRYALNGVAWRYLLAKQAIPHVVVHSAWVGDIAARYGQSRERMSIISLGCDDNPEESRHKPAAAGTATFVTVGGIAHTKGYHDAIAAVAGLRDIFGAIKYRIIGEVRDPSYHVHLEQLISRFRLHDQVQIASDLSNEDKQSALDDADVYLQPSHEEGFCLSFMEAAFCVPRLIGTDTGAIRSIAARDPGARVTAPRRPAELLAAAKDLLSTVLPEDLMRQRRKRLAEHFSWNKYLDAHEALYASMLNGSTRSTADRR